MLKHRLLPFCAESVSSEAAFLEDYVLGTGDTLGLSCDLEDLSQAIIWFKDGVGLVPNNRTRLGQRLLRIINVSYEDSGVYACRLAHSNVLLNNRTVRVTGERSSAKIKHPKRLRYVWNRPHTEPNNI